MVCASKDQLGLNLNQLLLMVNLFFKHDFENIFGSHQLFVIRGRLQALNEIALTDNAHRVVSYDAGQPRSFLKELLAIHRALIGHIDIVPTKHTRLSFIPVCFAVGR